MKRLTVEANVITPNLTELCFLADESYGEITGYAKKQDYVKRIQDICEKLLDRAHVQQTVIVTGILRKEVEKEMIGNLAVSGGKSTYLETPYTGKGFSGTGDLFASVVCGALINGLPADQAMEKAVSFLQEAIEEASKEDIPTNHGVYFEKYLSRLLQGGAYNEYTDRNKL